MSVDEIDGIAMNDFMDQIFIHVEGLLHWATWVTEGDSVGCSDLICVLCQEIDRVAEGKEMSRKDKWAVMAFKPHGYMRARKQHSIHVYFLVLRF